MLILGRKDGEEINIGNDITIKVISISQGQVKLGLIAPKDVQILRSEIDNMFDKTLSVTLAKEKPKSTNQIIDFFLLLKEEFNETINKRKKVSELIKASEARFKKLFYKNPIPIIITLYTDGTIIDVNDKFCELINLDKNFIIGNTTLDLNIYPNKTFRENMLRSISEDRGLKNITLKFINNSGVQLETIVAYEMIELDGIKYILDMFLDVTYLHKAEEQNKLHAKMLNSIGQAVIAVDLKHNIIFWNQAAEKLYQWTASEVLGKNLKSIAPTNSTLIEDEDIIKTLENAKTWSGEFLIKRKDGSAIPALITLNTINNSSGILTSIVSISYDISDIKNRELELSETGSKAEDMSMLKSHFLSSISHELRTPLTGILGFSDILEDEISNPEHSKMIKDIKKGGERLLESINSILELSSLEANKYDIKVTLINITKILREVVKSFETSISIKNIYLRLSIPDNDVMINSDERIVKTIISNLINNAVTFTQEGGITVSLEATENDFVKITVKDTGIGISDENKKIIFDAFRQGSEGYGRIAEGFGLGLTLVKNFLNLINGEITLNSKVDEGSQFTVTLPITEKRIFYPKVSNNPGLMLNDTQKSPNEKLKVMLVENDVSNAAVVKLILQNKYFVEIAQTGESALKLIKIKDYDIFLMDINLGEGMDGLMLTKMIRNMPKYSQTPIIAITAYAMQSDKDECINAGCSDYITKPFTKEILLNIISQFIS